MAKKSVPTDINESIDAWEAWNNKAIGSTERQAAAVAIAVIRAGLTKASELERVFADARLAAEARAKEASEARKRAEIALESDRQWGRRMTILGVILAAITAITGVAQVWPKAQSEKPTVVVVPIPTVGALTPPRVP